MKESTKQAIADGSKRQGGTIGVSVAVILSWLLSTYAGVNPPAEVTAAASGLFGAIGTYIQKQL